MRLYVAGPMTGKPEFNFPAFRAAEAHLRELGYDVENPINAFGGDTTKEWADYMKADIPKMLGCDGIATLPGWENSKGASLEVYIAKEIGMPVEPFSAWDISDPSKHPTVGAPLKEVGEQSAC